MMEAGEVFGLVDRNGATRLPTMRSECGGLAVDREFLIDLFADFGPVTVRRMFSGYGISADGTNFALALRAGLFLRADEETIPRFEAEGSRPFSYQTSTRSVTVRSYWQLPARLFDDTEELSEWAKAALGAARRAALTKRPRTPRKAKETQPAVTAVREAAAVRGRQTAKSPATRTKRSSAAKARPRAKRR
jgi:DNA transformation protein